MVIIGMVIIVIWSVVINGMNTDDNLKSILIMDMMKMDKGGYLKKTKNLKNDNKY
jgi:hypothetical protein